MTFLAPLGLLSLLVLPLILVLHLVRRRRNRVRVPSLQLWALSNTEVQRKRRRLPLTLLLILHLLVAAALALALGRPRLPGTPFSPTRLVVILDISRSMATADGSSAGASRLDAAKANLRDLLAATRNGDHVAVVTLSSVPRLLGRGGVEAASALTEALGPLVPAGSDGDLQAALRLATAGDEAGDSLRERIVVLTDRSFQVPTPATSSTGDAPANVPLVVRGALDWRTFGGPAENVAVVALAARPLRTGGYQLYARVANFGERQAARVIDVVLDGKVAQSEQIRLDPGAEAEWSWPLPRGTNAAEVCLTPGDAASADDRAATVLVGGTQRRIQLISAAPTPLERSLRALPGVEVILAAPNTYRHDPNADAAVFVEYVPSQLPPVPTLIVAPPRENTLIPVIGTKRDLRATSVPDVRFSSIDLRSILFSRVVQVAPATWADVSVAADDIPLVLTGVFEEQARTIWTFDPSQSNLAGRLAFPLLTAASLRTLLPQSSDALIVGEPAPQELLDPDGTRILAGTPLPAPGLYRSLARDGQVAVNAIDPAESDLREHQPPSVISQPQPLPAAQIGADQQLWRPLVMLALGLLMLEWLYSQRRAVVRRAPLPRRAT